MGYLGYPANEAVVYWAGPIHPVLRAGLMQESRNTLDEIFTHQYTLPVGNEDVLDFYLDACPNRSQTGFL